MVYSSELPNEIPCEKIDYFEFFTIDIDDVKTCDMAKDTEINSTGFEISTSDPSVLALSFDENPYIQFLPENTAKKFINLEVYTAGMCSIHSVSKANFKDLNNLRFLLLSFNAIEKIDDNTFEDLILLEHLWLGE